MRLRRLLSALAAATLALVLATLALALAAPARAEVLIRIDKSAQIMTVTVDGTQRYAWPVSTGMRGYDTPNGEFAPFRMERHHFSREWDDAPMPYSIFFTQQGHAIHGSGHVKAIGTPASHGCVRLAPANAAVLFALVKQQGKSNARVLLVGTTPSTGVAMARRERNTVYDDEDSTGALPPPRQRVVRGYYAAPRYYYRARPYYAPRYYYRYGGSRTFFPF